MTSINFKVIGLTQPEPELTSLDSLISQNGWWTLYSFSHPVWLFLEVDTLWMLLKNNSTIILISAILFDLCGDGIRPIPCLTLFVHLCPIKGLLQQMSRSCLHVTLDPHFKRLKSQVTCSLLECRHVKLSVPWGPHRSRRCCYKGHNCNFSR